MEKQNKDWYTNYKEEQLNRDIRRCNAFAITSGAVSTLSALVVAGNIVVGNGLEALQVGGATAALFSYLICYSQMGDTYKKELKSVQERKPNQGYTIKDKLESLRTQLEINKTQLNMEYLVSGSFFASALGHVIELLTIPDAPQMIACVTGAALASLVATLNLVYSKKQKMYIALKQNDLEQLEAEQELEEASKQPIPELVEPQDALVVETPTEEETPKILQLEDIPKKK